MRRFQLEHRRQQKYRAVLVVVVAVVSVFLFFNYGQPTGRVTDAAIELNDPVFQNVLENEQIALFIEYHPDYQLGFRELDAMELQVAKVERPHIYGSLGNGHYEVELSSGDARIRAIVNADGKVVKIYNPKLE